ncbi:hypothetical protein A2U01_0026791, partial [Trifolium medium]|nr:hypothetical protein [Trifolium medium]
HADMSTLASSYIFLVTTGATPEPELLRPPTGSGHDFFILFFLSSLLSENCGRHRSGGRLRFRSGGQSGN